MQRQLATVQSAKEKKTMVENFEFHTPTRVVFGRDTEKRTGELVKALGIHKVMIIYGGGSAIRSGLVDRVRASLDASGIEYTELGGVTPNPRLSFVYKGIEKGRAEGIEMLLAVGGGSVIDASKAIGYGLANAGDVWDFYDFKRKAKACLPVGVVLTIAATGSEMSDSSVITNDKTLDKRSYNNDLGRPVFAVMNPELTMTLPAYQTACGCCDIIMHTLERYFTNGGQMELTDSIAEALLRTVMKESHILKEHPDDYDARAEVMWAGSLSHNDLTGCGHTNRDFATHRLEHEVSGLFDVAHGAGLTSLWGSWARYVYKDCLPRFKRFALKVMDVPENGTDEEIALKGISAMEDFFKSMDMPLNFHELGIHPTEEQLRELAHRCSVTAHDHLGSAKVLHEADMYAIYKAAAEK
jgi:alcohol dehydrogenase YqhD (iron-dependent ADH family)